jgi:hypothetical protein
MPGRAAATGSENRASTTDEGRSPPSDARRQSCDEPPPGVARSRERLRELVEAVALRGIAHGPLLPLPRRRGRPLIRDRPRGQIVHHLWR